MWVVIMLTMVGKTQGQGSLTVSISSQFDTLCYGQTEAYISANVGGGMGPYSYLWNTVPPQTNWSLYNMPAGTYTVTVTCVDTSVHPYKLDTSVASIIIHEDSQIVITAYIDSIKCYGGTGSITLNVVGGTPPYTYSWSNGSTSATASNLIAGTYTIYEVKDAPRCYSNTLSFTLNSLPIPEICYVEFDTATSKNCVFWPSNLPENMDSICVFKEVSTNVWNKIGSVLASKAKFIDINSNPNTQSYSYRISAIDTCNKESDTSAYQTTITLIVSYSPTSNSYGFTWSAYNGLSVPNYYLYGVTNSGAETLIDSVPGNQYLYNYTSPNPAFVKFFVGFNTLVCGGYSSRLTASAHHLVKSNWVQSTTGIEESAEISKLVSVYPNPVTDNLQLQTTLQIKSIDVTDITGRLLCITNAKTINCRSFASGVYFIRAITEKGMVVKKFVKE